MKMPIYTLLLILSYYVFPYEDSSVCLSLPYTPRKEITLEKVGFS